MNRIRLTISDESGKSLCKIGTSIDLPKGFDYTDEEIADVLVELSETQYAAHKQRVSALVGKWKDVLTSESNLATAMLIESQEVPFEV